jgi:acyl carrier protein
MSEVETVCAEVIGKILEIDQAEISDESSPDTLPEWDSLMHLRIILELEKAFSIDISPEEGIEMENFQMICNYINERTKN